MDSSLVNGPLEEVLDTKEYYDASGKKVIRHGRTKPLLTTQTEQEVHMNFEKMDVKRHLVSVEALVQKGHSVHMMEQGSHIQTKNKEKIPIYQKNGVVVMPAWHDGRF